MALERAARREVQEGRVGEPVDLGLLGEYCGGGGGVGLQAGYFVSGFSLFLGVLGKLGHMGGEREGIRKIEVERFQD